MVGPEFFQTRMGVTFYEGTLPRIAKALERIADTLEAGLSGEYVCGWCGGDVSVVAAVCPHCSAKFTVKKKQTK